MSFMKTVLSTVVVLGQKRYGPPTPTAHSIKKVVYHIRVPCLQEVDLLINSIIAQFCHCMTVGTLFSR